MWASKKPLHIHETISIVNVFHSLHTCSFTQVWAYISFLLKIVNTHIELIKNLTCVNFEA